MTVGVSGQLAVGLAQPPCLISRPLTPNNPVAGLFAARTVSHREAGHTHQICTKNTWTRSGTEDFLVREERKGRCPIRGEP